MNIGLVEKKDRSDDDKKNNIALLKMIERPALKR